MHRHFPTSFPRAPATCPRGTGCQPVGFFPGSARVSRAAPGVPPGACLENFESLGGTPKPARGTRALPEPPSITGVPPVRIMGILPMWFEWHGRPAHVWHVLPARGFAYHGLPAHAPQSCEAPRASSGSGTQPLRFAPAPTSQTLILTLILILNSKLKLKL